ncbi:MAG: hypothetical protein ACOYOQ_00340 [Microthrixaceae bacterium]
MPLLAEAYADAHLNLDALDKDIDRAEAKILSAVERLQKKLNFKVNVDTSQAIVRLREVQVAADQIRANLQQPININLNADVADAVAEAAAAEQTIRNTLQDVNVTIGADTEEAATKLAAIESLTAILGQTRVAIAVNAEGEAEVITGLGAIKTVASALDGTDITINLDADVAGFTADLAGFLTLLRAAGLRVTTQVDVDGIAQSSAEIVAYRGELALIPNKVTTVLDVDRSITSRLSSLTGGGSGGFLRNLLSSLAPILAAITSAVGAALTGIGQALSTLGQGAGQAFSFVADIAKQVVDGAKELVGAFKGVGDSVLNAGQQAAEAGGQAASAVNPLAAVVGQVAEKLGEAVKPALQFAQAIAAPLIQLNTYGALATALGTILAYLAPIATGAVAAAGGLLAFAGAAILAVGAVGGLAVLLGGELEELFNGVKGQLQSILATTLAPIRDFIVNDVINNFVASLAILVQRLAPFFQQAFGPIIEPLLTLFDFLGQVAGPVAVAVGQGIGQLVTTFTAFVQAIDVNVVVEQVQLLFSALDNLLRLLGESGIAAIPLLTAAFKGLSDVFAGLIPFFRQIITVAANNGVFQSLFQAISTILGPLKFLGQLFGEFLAQLSNLGGAAGFENIFKLVQVIVPLANFGLIADIFERLGPAVANFLVRIGPLVDLLQAQLFQLVDQLFTPDNITVFFSLLEELLVVFAQVGNAIVSLGPIISGVFQASINAVRLFIAVLSNFVVIVGVVGLAFFTLLDGIQEAVSAGLTLISKVALAVGTVVPGFTAVGEALQDASTGYNTLSDSTTGFFQSLVTGGVDVIAAQAGIGDLSNQMDGLGESVRQNQTDLNAFSVEVGGTVGTLSLAGDQAERLADRLKDVAKSFGASTKLIDSLSGDLKKGGLFKQAQSDANKAIQTAQRTAKEQAATAKRAADSALSGGQLSSFFKIDLDTNDAEKKAEDAAKKVGESIQKFLSNGRLSSFFTEETFNVGYAFDKLIRTIEVKADNIARLKWLDSLGLSNVAVQLATLNDNPLLLKKALDQLLANGLDAARGFEGRLAGVRGGIEGQLKGLSPGLAAALGEQFGKDAEKKIKEGDDNINTALQKLTDNFRLKAQNIRRLQELQNLGFGDLAAQLVSLNDDPKALDAALNQLAAQGVAGYQRANAQLVGARNELVAAQGATTGLLASQLKQGGDEVGQAAEEVTATLDQSIEQLTKNIQLRVSNIRRVLAFEELFKKNNVNPQLLTELAGLEPEELAKRLDELAAKGEEGALAAGRAVGDAYQQGIDAVSNADVDMRLKAALDITGAKDQWELQAGQLVQSIQTLVTAMNNAINGVKAADPGGVTAEAMARRQGRIPDGAAAEPVTNAIDGVRRSAEAQKDALAESGRITGKAFTGGIGEGITAAENIDGIRAALTNIVGEFSDGKVQLFNPGVNGGSEFVAGIARGITNGAGGPLEAVTNALNLVTSVSNVIAFGSGIGAGDGFARGLGFGFSVALPGVVETLTAGIRGVIDQLLEPVRGFGFALGLSLMGGYIDGVGSLKDLVTFTLGAALQNQSLIATTREFGRVVGASFGEGVSVGLNSQFQLIKTQVDLLASYITLTLRAALGINSPSTVAIDIGVQFGAGLAIGLARSQSPVERAANALATSAANGLKDGVSDAVKGVWDPLENALRVGGDAAPGEFSLPTTWISSIEGVPFDKIAAKYGTDNAARLYRPAANDLVQMRQPAVAPAPAPTSTQVQSDPALIARFDELLMRLTRIAVEMQMQGATPPTGGQPGDSRAEGAFVKLMLGG